VQNHFLTAALIKKVKLTIKIRGETTFQNQFIKKQKKSIYTYLIGNLRGVCEEKSLQVLVGSLPVLDDRICNGLHVSLIFTGTLSIFIYHVYKALRYLCTTDKEEKKIFLA
jgi:hypothetical protein